MGGVGGMVGGMGGGMGGEVLLFMTLVLFKLFVKMADTVLLYLPSAHFLIQVSTTLERIYLDI